MHRIAAYIAADGTVHKEKTEAAVADITHIISAKLEAPKAYDSVGLRDAHIRMAAHAILVAADQVREILNQYIDPCDFLIPDYVAPARPRPQEHIDDANAYSGTSWTEADDAALRGYIRNDFISTPSIATVMSRDAIDVARRIAYLGLKVEVPAEAGISEANWTALDDSNLRVFAADGHSWDTIAFLIGKSDADWLRDRHAFLTEHDAERPAPVENIDV